MHGLDRMKELPALWINRPQDTDRAEIFLRETAPLFKSAYPITPHVFPETNLQVATEYVAICHRTRKYLDPAGYFDVIGQYRASQPTLATRPKLAAEYMATYSLFLTVVHALTFGVEMGYDRFMILEDDAVPRQGTLFHTDSTPDSDLLIWGGAVRRANVRRDEKQYRDYKLPAWVKIGGGDQRYFAHAYEVTAKGARTLIDTMMNHPMTADTSWWYAFSELNAHALEPMAFVQQGPSIRTRATRNGVTAR